MNKLPTSAGVCLKPLHFDFILENQPEIAWFEIHPENYFSAGGPHHRYLRDICDNYPLSMHGVGMSLGSSSGIQREHLNKLKSLVEKYQPAQVSEHLSWSRWQDTYINDLLPLPYTQESLKIVCANIQLLQETLGRRILIENPSVYLEFKQNEYSETEFLEELCKSTDCGILLDVNNIAVSSYNSGSEAKHYIDNIPCQYIGEVHLAGHATKPLIDGKTIRVDDHGSRVSEEVWKLLAQLVQRCSRELPLLIEWDTDIPPFSTLQEEAVKAAGIMHHALSEIKRPASAC